MSSDDLGVVASTRIGNLLGARSADAARHAAHASALASVLVGSAKAIVTSIQIFGYIYSDDEDVALLVSKVMPPSVDCRWPC